MSLWLAASFAVAFAVTNGFNDAANAVATLVATRGALPKQAIVLSAVFNMLGALLVGSAVANTIAGIVRVAGPQAVPVIGSGALGAVAWNLLTWWRGLPSSSGHALVGALAGSALTQSGISGVRWGGFTGWRPAGVFGVLIALAVSPAIGLVFGFAFVRLARRVLRRAARAVQAPIRWAEWGMTSALSFSHGANDGQKSMGVLAALLLAAGKIQTFMVPLWASIACGVALTAGTALGGWRIVQTVGRRIFHLAPVDGLASQSGSAAVIFTASYLGAPVSTAHVVASSVVGAGAGTGRWRHVRWGLVGAIAFAWLLTLPASAALGAAVLLVWKVLT